MVCDRLCRSINDITTNAQIRANLTALYGSIDNIDALVGALAEDPKFGSVGPLVNAIIGGRQVVVCAVRRAGCCNPGDGEGHDCGECCLQHCIV